MARTKKSLVLLGLLGLTGAGLYLLTRKAAALPPGVPSDTPPGATAPTPTDPGTDPSTEPEPEIPVLDASTLGGVQVGRDPLPLQTRAIAAKYGVNGKPIEWFKGEGGRWFTSAAGYGDYRSIGMLARNQPIVALVHAGSGTLFANAQWYPHAMNALGIMDATLPLSALD